MRTLHNITKFLCAIQEVVWEIIGTIGISKPVCVLLIVAMAASAAPVSLTTETVVTSNRLTRVFVFRAAGDMVSTNKITATRLTAKDTAAALANSFLSKKQLDANEAATGKKPAVIAKDVVIVAKEEPKRDGL